MFGPWGLGSQYEMRSVYKIPCNEQQVLEIGDQKNMNPVSCSILFRRLSEMPRASSSFPLPAGTFAIEGFLSAKAEKCPTENQPPKKKINRISNHDMASKEYDVIKAQNNTHTHWGPHTKGYQWVFANMPRPSSKKPLRQLGIF